MMFEAPNEVPIPGEPKRRWFTDDDFDLFVWYNPDDTYFGFQLCYDKNGDQHAFTWRQDSGFSHKRVDDGDRCQRSSTEFLVPDGVFNWNTILARFQKESRQIEAAIVELVTSKIQSYGKELQ